MTPYLRYESTIPSGAGTAARRSSSGATTVANQPVRNMN
jgi:hypothetical protein